VLSRLARYVINVYQRDVAASIGAACPQQPSCSEYALDTYASEPFLRATVKVVRRVHRCRPATTPGSDYCASS
jgi:putative membrane protein insertion efficiency factor